MWLRWVGRAPPQGGIRSVEGRLEKESLKVDGRERT